MIKINLLGDDTGKDPRGVLFVGGYVLSVVVLAGILFFLQNSISSKINEGTGRVATLEGQLAQLQKTTQAVKELEKKRNELTMKLSIIARLKLSKIGPVHVLDDLNVAIPNAAWITEVREKSNELKIIGYALDPQTVSLFLTGLEKSEYYKKVDLEEAKAATKQGVKIQEFRLKAAIDYAGEILTNDLNQGTEKGKDMAEKGPNEEKVS